MPETPQERQERMRAEMRQRAGLFKKLVDEFGPRVLEVVQQQVIDGARTQFANMPLPKRDLNAVIALWESAGGDVEFTIEERTPEHLKFRATWCIWADEMRKQDAAEIGNAFYCCFDYGFCQGLNPAIRFTRTQTLMNGDDCCDHAYDLSGADKG